MLQKCTILALLLLLAGGLTYAWVYNEARQDEAQAHGQVHAVSPEEYLERYGQWYKLTREEQDQIFREMDQDRNSKTLEQFSQEQQARLKTDLDRLASGEMHPGDIADFLYGVGWEEQVELHKKHQEQMEITKTICIVCLAIGGALLGICVLGWILRLFVRLAGNRRQRMHAEPEEPEAAAQELTDIEPHDEPEEPDEPEAPEAMEERPKSRRKILTASEMTGAPDTAESPLPDRATADAFLAGTWTRRAVGESLSSPSLQAAEDDVVAVLLADEPSAESHWSPETQWSAQGAFAIPAESPQPPRPPAVEPEVSVRKAKDTQATENTLKEHAEGLQKQIAEFKEMAQTVQQATQAEPLGDTLKELAQQVSAIREYAASQQDRVEKLQDGYDWGIVRTFCLRVIRCIDNIENRLDRLGDEEARIHLEDVRDELLFALESSNVEQYRPEVNSEFRGQEKLAETMKEREPAPTPDLTGKIGRVVRPGYRYMVDEENYKVVRTSQVKLFG